MTNDKLKNVWKIMKDIRLQFDQRSDNEICCVICNRTLINAHSSPCGCRYCLECIQGYLNEGDQICPGNTDNCTDELLNMDRDIHIDQPMNRKIFKTIVKCPEDNCEFKDELRNIEDHLQISHNQLVNCPYFNIGCNLSGIKSKDVKNHLLAEIVSHNQMMFQVIENLQKDNKDLRESIIHLESKYEKENREMKEKSEEIEVNKMVAEQLNILMDHFGLSQMCIQDFQAKYEEEIQGIIKNIKDLKKHTQDSQTKYDRQNQEIRKHVKDLREYVINLQSKQIDENREIKERLKEIEKSKLVEVQKYNKDSQTKLKIRNQKIVNNFKKIRNQILKEKKENKTKFEEINLWKINLSLNNEGELSAVKDRMNKLEKNQELQNHGAFVWIIDNWRMRSEEVRQGINEEIYSDAFYTHKNGYKMCLCVYLNGHGVGRGTHLSIFFCLMKGEFDSSLSWPFKHDVTIELIDQQTGQVHTSRTLSYDIDPKFSEAFKRPTGGRNIGYGKPQFLLLGTIRNNRLLNHGNTISIRCKVDIK